MTKTLFSDDHEYLHIADSPDGMIGTVGITDFAQKALGDVVYVELPTIGKTLEKGGIAGVVESVKSASEIYAPITGIVIAINTDLTSDPALVNRDPENTAWFFKVKIAPNSDLSSLKDRDAYLKYIQG